MGGHAMTDKDQVNRDLAGKLGIIPKLCQGCMVSRDDALTNPYAECRHEKSYPDFYTEKGRIDLLKRMMEREDWEKFKESVVGRGRMGRDGDDFFLSFLTNDDGLLARAAMGWLEREER
jgi:hypothetical protein